MSDLNAEVLTQKSIIEPKQWWQKRAFNSGVALLGLLLIIVIMTINVAKYESHLATGDTVLLALAPIDPRGFMQGDYMTLSYALEREVFDALPADSANVEEDAAEEPRQHHHQRRRAEKETSVGDAERCARSLERIDPARTGGADSRRRRDRQGF